MHFTLPAIDGPNRYQHEARGADKDITDAIDMHVDDEHRQDDDGDDGPAGARVPA
jgi:hypothetical protein